ncbi:FAD-dependent oxidoreductase [Mycoplasmopsis pulmonis]|nr:FAD-dependent oxidoreductase [Mycoplasmopsis pulmonis]
MKVVVVGANHAGTSFIRTFKQLNKTDELVVYDRNTNTSFLGCGIALWVGGEFKSPEGLFYSSPEKLAKLGAKVHLEKELINVDYKTKTLTFKDLQTNKEFTDTYDKLVFSLGTSPIVPPFKGIDYKNIIVSKLFQHAEEIFKKAESKEVKNVVVIGAGYIGVELAEAFIKHGKNTTLVDLQERVIPNYFDEEFTSKMEDSMRKHGLKVQLGEKVQEFQSKDGTNVSAVVTDKGTYEADLVILAIGFRPNAQFLNFDKTVNGALKVSPRQNVLLDGQEVKEIYAIGDSAAMIHNVTNQHQHVALATNAVKTGVIAALDMVGQGIDFPGVTGTNAISVFGCHYSSTGMTEKSAKNFGINAVSTEYFEDFDRPEFMNDKSKVGFKVTYEKRTLRLLGAQVGSWSDHIHTEVIYAFSLAIQQGLTLPQLALMDVYFLPHFNKPFNFMLTPILKALGINYE